MLLRSSESVCSSSEACESVDVSTLGLLDREESEDIWDECWEAALDFSLEPHDVALNLLLGVDSSLDILIGGS